MKMKTAVLIVMVLGTLTGCSDDRNSEQPPVKSRPSMAGATNNKLNFEAYLDGPKPAGKSSMLPRVGLTIQGGQFPVAIDLNTEWEITVSAAGRLGLLEVSVPIFTYSANDGSFTWHALEPELNVRLSSYVSRKWTSKGGLDWEFGKEFTLGRLVKITPNVSGSNAGKFLTSHIAKLTLQDGKLTFEPVAKDWLASQVWLESTKGLGTEFKLRGPLLQANPLLADQSLDFHKDLFQQGHLKWAPVGAEGQMKP